MRHPPTLHSGDIDWKSVRLLLFSADDAFRFLVRQTFRKLNVRDVLSTSIAADTQAFMKQAPDIALIDLETDTAAGLACLERVRATDEEMPVLVVCRSDDKAAMLPALKLGIEGAVPKRVSGHELAHRVSQTVMAPKRMPAPVAAAPRPRIVLDKPAHTTVKAEAAAAAAIASASATAASGDALKRELAALTARLGQSPVVSGSVGKGGGASGGAVISGGRGHAVATAGGGIEVAATGRPANPSAGAYAFDAPAPVAKPSGGKLDFDDFEVMAPKVSGGRLIEDEPPAAKRDQAIELRRAKDDAAARLRAEADKAKWKDLLDQAGHKTRTGKDVAQLDVSAIVAEHGAWLTSKGAEGKRATFQGMDLAGADLSGAVLANATFRDVDLSDAHLVESRLDGADFRYAVLGAANLARAELGVAQLRHADLRLANLEGANLRGADLSGARLAGAKLEGADFGGVTLVAADLREADLSMVENMRQSQVEKALCDMKTKLPPGIFRPRKDGD